MVTKDDLVVISSQSFYEGHQRDVVQHEGRYYIVGSQHCPVARSDGDNLLPAEEEALFAWFSTLDFEMQMMFATGMAPLDDTWVMEATWDDDFNDYIPKNVCGPHCETGVCNKRLASNTEVGDQNLAYSMLISHLNA